MFLFSSSVVIRLKILIYTGMFATDIIIVKYSRGGLIGYVKSKPLGNGQIIGIDVLVIVMIIPVFHKKLI